MLLNELAGKTQCKRQTLDRYVRFGLIPFNEGPGNGYRHFDDQAIERVELIRTLTKKPFKRDLEEISFIFQKAPIAELMAKLRMSEIQLFSYLVENKLL
jgi:DNA-binding transcriptional MerR regulator